MYSCILFVFLIFYKIFMLLLYFYFIFIIVISYLMYTYYYNAVVKNTYTLLNKLHLKKNLMFIPHARRNPPSRILPPPRGPVLELFLYFVSFAIFDCHHYQICRYNYYLQIREYNYNVYDLGDVEHFAFALLQGHTSHIVFASPDR